MIKAYTNLWRNAFNFSGRTSRREFWLAFAANMIAAFILGAIAGLISGILAAITDNENVATVVASIPTGLYSLAVFIPSIAIVVRRLHDTGRTGWWYLICLAGNLLCGIGSIVLLVFECQAGQPGDNQCGPDPNGFNNYGNGAYGQNNPMGGLGNGYNQNMNGMNNYGQNMNNMNGYNQNPNGYQQNNMNGYGQNNVNNYNQNNNNQF